MEKRNLKILIRDLETILSELKAEVYSDAAAYTHTKHPSVGNYLQTNDDDGDPD